MLRKSAPPPASSAAVEWPTVALAITITCAWLALTWFWTALPLWLLVPLGAWTIAWHGSLQHEVLHGHPTRIRWLNDAIGFPPLSLWLPYARYKALHLAHHRDERLTDPLDDPESQYWTRADWARQSRIVRGVVALNATLAGRLTIGPPFVIGRFLLSEARAIRAGQPGVAAAWGLHALGVAAVLAWVVGVCGIPLWFYLLAFVWPGASLMLVRSFAEHRADLDVGRRTALVEDAPVLGVLFLYNNLHVVHHMRPGLPWYEIPAWHRTHRATLVRRNGGLVYRGYADVARRFLLRPHDQPVHPLRGS